MRQDVKFNGWVLISSILQIIASVVCIGAGAALAIVGFFNASKLLKIEELKFFVNQDGLIRLQKSMFGGVLIKKYLFLIIGSLIAIIGIIALVLAIVELLYVKRYKVVNRRATLMMFSIVPLAIAICVEVYLVLEYDLLKTSIDYIKNVRIGCFAICGVFSACAIFKLIGVLFSKSEQFVSNDNGKYAFEGPKSNKLSQSNQNLPANQVRAQMPINQVQNRSANRMNGAIKNQNERYQSAQGLVRLDNSQVRPNNVMQTANSQQDRSVVIPRPGVNSQQARPAVNQAVLQSSAQNNAVSQRPMPSRGTNTPLAGQTVNSQRVRPAQAAHIRRCPKCGKTLMPNERVCSICSKISHN